MSELARHPSAENSAEVSIIMGSRSDWPTMQKAAEILGLLGVDYETRVVSAHRTPDRMVEFAKSARSRGVKVIIAGAGGAAAATRAAAIVAAAEGHECAAKQRD